MVYKIIQISRYNLLFDFWISSNYSVLHNHKIYQIHHRGYVKSINDMNHVAIDIRLRCILMSNMSIVLLSNLCNIVMVITNQKNDETPEN